LRVAVVVVVTAPDAAVVVVVVVVVVCGGENVNTARILGAFMQICRPHRKLK